MIRLFATLCSMFTVSPGMPAVEFCNEVVIAEKPLETDVGREMAACNVTAQQQIAAMLPEGYTVRDFRCDTDKGKNFRPRNSI